MGYNKLLKEEILKEIANGLGVREAAKKYHVHRTTIYHWLRGTSLVNTFERNIYSIKEKYDVIKQIESEGKKIREIASETDIKAGTIRNWIKDKNHIYAVYYTEKHSGSEDSKSYSVKERQDMDSKDGTFDEHLENKALREENQYLKAKIMYLEKLMDLNGTPAPDFKKKRGTAPSERSQKEKE